MEPFVLYPSKIYLVKEDRVQDGTVTTLDSLKADASVYAIPRKGEEGVTLNWGEEGFMARERSSSGVMLDMKNFRSSQTLTFTINLARWTFEIESLLRGQHIDTVESDHTASIAASDDATAIKGIALANGILLQEFTILFEMLADPSSDETLYMYVPKATRDIGDREQVLNAAQIASPMPFRALALDDSVSPSQVTAHQAIYSDVTADGLGFFFKGKVDAV